jgi:7,8-dihydro-6-hydroxymethylpterin dimethyltransferase
VAGSAKTASLFSCDCGPAMDLGQDLRHLKNHIFQIAIKDFMDAYTFSVKQVMKCCVGVLVPDGRLIPFCAYNAVGYREQVRAKLSRRPEEQKHGNS